MQNSDIQELAQSLVDFKKEIKLLENKIGYTKLDLYYDAEGGIQCNGGKVYFVKEGDENRFNQEKLKEALAEAGLTESKIEDILSKSKKTTHREANIKIVLDKNA